MFTNVYNSRQEDSFVDKKLKVSMKKYNGETSVVSLRMPNEKSFMSNVPPLRNFSTITKNDVLPVLFLPKSRHSGS